MAVRSFMAIVEAHAAAQEHINQLIGKTVCQGREHAPPSGSFNRRAIHIDGAGTNAGMRFADFAASAGLITPHQRYEIAMQRDIG